MSRPQEATTARVGFWVLAFCLPLVLMAAAQGATPQQASCRISNQLANWNNVGSGTLVDRTNNGQQGLILTCAHLFTEGIGEITVTFPDGQSYMAKVLDQDKEADLAALVIANPHVQPVQVSYQQAQGNLAACGFGGQGHYRCAVGPPAGESRSRGQLSLLVASPVRSGDSGGGVFDSQGRLVAVVWGEAEGVTYASYGTPLRNFLGRILQRARAGRRADCPDGTCPLQAPQQPVAPAGPDPFANLSPPTQTPTQPWQPVQVQPQPILPPQVTEPSQPQYIPEAEAPETPSPPQPPATDGGELAEAGVEGIGSRLGTKAGVLATGALGISGPAGWALCAAFGLGGSWLGRAMLRRAQSRVQSTFGGDSDSQPATQPVQEPVIYAATQPAPKPQTQEVIEYVTIPRDVNEAVWKRTKQMLSRNPSPAMMQALRTIEDVKTLVFSGDPDGTIHAA